VITMSRNKSNRSIVTDSTDVPFFPRLRDIEPGTDRLEELVLYIEEPIAPRRPRSRPSGRMDPPSAEEAYNVTSRFLCRVPVANDVRYCRCHGVLSQRLNGSLFCRRCHHEEGA
jgi:hypothetical protein